MREAGLENGPVDRPSTAVIIGRINRIDFHVTGAGNGPNRRPTEAVVKGGQNSAPRGHINSIRITLGNADGIDNSIRQGEKRPPTVVFVEDVRVRISAGNSFIEFI